MNTKVLCFAHKMSQKRKYEELGDPDYPQNSKYAKKQPVIPTADERLEKIRLVVKREFHKELMAKEQEVFEIENRIQLARRLLHRVRYAVVFNYYNRKGMELPESDYRQSVECLAPENSPVSKTLQTAIHPALKGILGKKTVDYDEILKIRPIREAAKTAKTTIKEKLRTKKEEKRLHRSIDNIAPTTICHDTSLKIPRHVEPIKVQNNIPQLNAARGRNQTKHLIAVGNTSKFVGDEKDAGGVTHKWLVYVRTKTSFPIEKIVTRVRFFLHPSYRPNDIVDVCDSPFQLSRRGWGEFTIRLQLFFDPSLQQKPVQLMHNLVLDKSLSGLQTMGAETLVEIWLCTDKIQESADSCVMEKEFKHIKEETCESIDEDKIVHIEHNLMEFLSKIENQTSESSYEKGEKIEPTLTVPPVLPISNIIMKSNDILRLTVDSSVSNSISEPPIVVKREPAIEIKEAMVEKNTSTRPTNKPTQSTNIGFAGVVAIKPVRVASILNGVVSSTNGGVLKQNKPLSVLNGIEMNQELVKNTANIQQMPMAALNSVENKTPTFQRRFIKCVDKQGTVKFVQMLVNPTELQNGQSKQIILNPPASQKNFIVSKLNGQSQNSSQQALLLKIAPPSSNNNTVASFTSTTSNITNLTSKLPPSKILMPSTSDLTNTSKHQHQQLITNSTIQKPSASSTNKNQILFKNGKMYIIDSLQSKLNQCNKKQESLLKPQVSLLKPIVKNDNLKNCMRNGAKSIFNHTAIATDHDYTSLMGKSPTPNTVTIYRPSNQQQFIYKQKSSIVTVNTPKNSRINVIVTKLDDDEDKFQSNTSCAVSHKPTPLMQKPRRDYQKELEQLFRKEMPTSIRQAIEFLLKRLPLIDEQAASIDYKLSFPFVVRSLDTFDQLMTPKQKSNEWLRAKYISKFIRKNTNVNDLKLWTTKEIVLFARFHAFTPVITYCKSNKKVHDSVCLKDLVKKEIKREIYDIQTQTLANESYDWINQVKKKVEGRLNIKDELINVDGSDDEETNLVNEFNMESPLKRAAGQYFHPIDSKYEIESSLVNEFCQQIGIRLKPEEIITDVIHSSAQSVLMQCLRSFVEDLIRRAVASKAEVYVISPIVENVIKPDDIKSAILSRPQWDFLTNNGLGMAKPKSQID